MVTDSGFMTYLRQETAVHDALAATYAEAAAECAAHEGWRLCTRAELALTDDKDDPAYCVGTACSANERCSKYKGYKQSRRDACFSQLVWSSDVCTEDGRRAAVAAAVVAAVAAAAEPEPPPSPPPASPPPPCAHLEGLENLSDRTPPKTCST